MSIQSIYASHPLSGLEADVSPLGDIPWSHEPALVATLKNEHRSISADALSSDLYLWKMIVKFNCLSICLSVCLLFLFLFFIIFFFTSQKLSKMFSSEKAFLSSKDAALKLSLVVLILILPLTSNYGAQTHKRKSDGKQLIQQPTTTNKR